MQHKQYAIAFGLAFTGIGTLALVAPKLSAVQYGLPTDDARGLALVRGLGVRDLAIGGILLSSRNDRRAVARICFWSAIVAIGDAACVASVRGIQPQHAVHISGGLAIALAGYALRDKPEPPPAAESATSARGNE